MSLMSMTLDVSRLSGWLNSFAFCAEVKESHEKEGGLWAEKESVGRSACVERTSNMPFMLVTSEVSRVSGWLNAFASCAEAKESHEKEGGWGHGMRETTNPKHVVHVSDAGRVDTQWLIERFRGLPSRKGVMCKGGNMCVGWQTGEVRRGRDAAGPGVETLQHKHSVPGRSLGIRGGTCAGRARNMSSMVVTLDVSRLSGWLNASALCRVERRACGGRCAGREAGGRCGGGGANSVQGGGFRLGIGAQGMRRSAPRTWRSCQ